MTIKRTLSLVLALCLCATLALAAGCNNSKGGSTADASSKATISLTAEDIYGGDAPTSSP